MGLALQLIDYQLDILTTMYGMSSYECIEVAVNLFGNYYYYYILFYYFIIIIIIIIIYILLLLLLLSLLLLLLLLSLKY